jgi:hypothetical protein
MLPPRSDSRNWCPVDAQITGIKKLCHMIAGNRGHGLEDPQSESRQQQDIALFSNTFLNALGATHPPIQGLPVLLPDGTAPGGGGGVKLTSHLHLASKFRMSGSVPPQRELLSFAQTYCLFKFCICSHVTSFP